MITCWLLPGSFTVTNCSSLYFSNAGPSWETSSGSFIVRALMSAEEGQVRAGFRLEYFGVFSLRYHVLRLRAAWHL